MIYATADELTAMLEHADTKGTDPLLLARHIHKLVAEVRERQRVIDDRMRRGGQTHWADCWRAHLDCAVLEVERLRGLLDSVPVSMEANADG